MYRALFISLLSLLLTVPSWAMAAPGIPDKGVWATPSDAAAGEVIELNAFVYNATDRQVTATVRFSAEEEEKEVEIVQVSIVLPANTAKVATAAWQQPKGAVTVSASVTKAIDPTGKSTPELIGVIGKASIGTEGTGSINGVEGTVKGVIGKVFSFVEPWRKARAVQFTALRNRTKEALGINSPRDILDAIPRSPDTPQVPGQEPTISEFSTQSSVPFGLYITLLYSTALAAIFSSIAIFYTTAILLALFILRFLFGLFR